MTSHSCVRMPKHHSCVDTSEREEILIPLCHMPYAIPSPAILPAYYLRCHRRVAHRMHWSLMLAGCALLQAVRLAGDVLLSHQHVHVPAMNKRTRDAATYSDNSLSVCGGLTMQPSAMGLLTLQAVVTTL